MSINHQHESCPVTHSGCDDMKTDVNVELDDADADGDTTAIADNPETDFFMSQYGYLQSCNEDLRRF